MKKFPIPNNEEERLKRLAYFDLLHLGRDVELDVFAESACLIANCSASLIAMMERDVQNVQSCIGLEFELLDRKDTVCQYTIEKGELLIIHDTLLDERTCYNPLIKASGIRFYAGIPLFDDLGFVLGTLCVVDYEPKTLSDKQIDLLKKLGSNISKVLLGKKTAKESHYFKQIFTTSHNLICVLDRDFNFKDLNPAFEKVFKAKKSNFLNSNFIDLLHKNNPDIELTFDLLVESKDEYIFTTSDPQDNETEIYVEWHLIYHKESAEIFCFGLNITHLVEENHQLQSSERRFRGFFENAIGLMSMHDFEGNILAINERGREVLQYSSEEIHNLTVEEIIPKRYLGNYRKYIRQINNFQDFSGTVVLKAKNGEETIWMYQNHIEKDESGKPYIISTALNVTEKTKLEKDLISTKKILEQANQVAQIGAWEWDLRLNKIVWSEFTRKIYNVDDSFEPSIENAMSFFLNDGREKIKSYLDRLINEGIPYDEELQLQQKGGKIIWIRVKGVGEFKNGVCTKVFGIIQNVDQFKKVYLELEKKEAMLRSFIKDAPAAIAMLDKNLNYLIASKAWEEELKLQNIDVYGKNLFEISKNVPQERIKIYFDALQGRVYKNEDILIDIPGKNPQHFNLEVGPWYMSEGEIGGVIVSTQNITNSVMANEKLKNAIRMAVIANKAKSEFLANMSHEIRTPLNGVIGFSDLLLKTPLTEVQAQYLNYINESGESLLNIINDILDFSKIESGKLELLIDKKDLYDLVGHVINVVLYQSQQKNIELLLNIEQGLPKYIFVDDSRLKQVLINLLGNAVKFTTTGEIELKVKKIKIEEESITLRFSVRDTGIGIPEAKQQRIFDAFIQEDSSVSKRYGGTGLGLTISNKILHYMGSELSLKSEIDVGSEFYFDLRVPYEQQKEDEETELNINKVLIIDDNKSNRLILQEMFLHRNVETTLAESGMEALHILLQGEHFDVIVVDYHMPIISGLETIEKIKEIFEKEGRTVPLIFLHTSSEAHNILHKVNLSENVVPLLKPVKSKELYDAIKKSISKPADDKIEVIVREESEKPLFKSSLKVLLVDDNKVNMVLNNKILTTLMPKVKLTEATDGLQAFEYCKTQVFDFILMDVQMPVMDGLESTRKIRTLDNYKNVPIIGVTAGNALEEKGNCLKAGMNDFLSKPLKQSELIDILMTNINILNDHNDLTVIEEELESHPNLTEDMVEDRFDIMVLNEQTGDDEDFKLIFLNLVIQELNSAKQNLEAAVKESDAEALKMLLHKLKGTAGTAGLKKLAYLAKDWEAVDMKKSYFNTVLKEISMEIDLGIKIIQDLIN